MKVSKVAQTERCPNGLFESSVTDLSLVEEAKSEVELLLKTVLLGQIASNQHLYVNLPHPLAAANNREAAVPCLSWGDQRIASIEKLFHLAMQVLGVTKQDEFDDYKRRANVIVREYKVRQHIPFHLDELECAGFGSSVDVGYLG